MPTLPSYAEVVAQSPMSHAVYAKHATINVRFSSRERIDRATALYTRLRRAEQRLAMQVPVQRWETIGSGKKAVRRPVRDPERDALMRRVNTLINREQAVLRLSEEMAWRLTRLAE